MDSLTLTTIKVFIKDKDPENLILKQIEMNTLNTVRFQFGDPVWNGKEWYSWFYADPLTHKMIDFEFKDELDEPSR